MMKFEQDNFNNFTLIDATNKIAGTVIVFIGPTINHLPNWAMQASKHNFSI